MIFKSYDSDSVALVFFRGYFFASLLLALLSLIGLISGAGALSTLCGVIYLAVVSLLSLNGRFRKSPFSILLCFFTFLYLNIPAAFILIQGNEYVFGEGLAAVPFVQSIYEQSLYLGFLCLSFFWMVVWLAIISVPPKQQKIDPERFSSIRIKYVVILGLIVLTVTWIDNQSYANVMLAGAEKGNSLLTFVFFDHAYMVLTGLVLFFKLNESRYLQDSAGLARLASVIFIAFVLLSFIAGSKAAILVTFMLLLFYPLCFFRMYPQAKVLLPPPKLMAILVLLAPLLFFFALIQRISLATGIAPDLNSLLSGLLQADGSVLLDTFAQICYRLSQGGLDRFLLLFQSFVVDGFDQVTADKFAHYLMENTANLILPGTPFPESYAPSSQLFPQVLDKNIVGGDVDAGALITSFNTQPYTIFGVFLIIFGLAAPAFLFLSIFCFIFAFNRLHNIFFKITMLYFFSSALSSYGIEAALGNAVHMIVSLLIMHILVRTFSRLQVKSLEKTKADRFLIPI